MESLLNSMRVLSEPTRLRLLLLLRAEELTVAELQEILGMGQSRISTHLSQLKAHGLATRRRVGKNIHYSAHGELPPELEGVLEAVARQLPETKRDRMALELAIKKRKDLATEYFNRLAGRFGGTYVPGRSWEALGHALLEFLPPMRIADLGAGEGTLSQLLARRAKKVIAVDNAPEMVAFGEKVAKENGIENLEFRLGDLEDPPIKNGEVDLVLFSQALHHAVHPLNALKAAHRILAAKGKLLILDLASHSYEQAREEFADRWMGFSEVELMEMMQRAGFADASVRVVATEQRAPHFRTILASAHK